MDVILLEDVKTLGKKGQIVKINDGYARNYVLPKKLGIEATAKNLNDLKLARKREEKEAAEELAMAMEARCYRGGYNRTKMRQSIITKSDYIAGCILIIYLVIIIITRFI